MTTYINRIRTSKILPTKTAENFPNSQALTQPSPPPTELRSVAAHKKYSNLHFSLHCKLPSPTSLPSSPFSDAAEHSFYIRILLAKVKNVNQKMFFVNITLPSVLRSRLADERYDRSQPRLSEWKTFMFLAFAASHFAFNRKQISKVRLTRNGKLI